MDTGTLLLLVKFGGEPISPAFCVTALDTSLPGAVQHGHHTPGVVESDEHTPGTVKAGICK
jgi:hypothetical protein